MGETADPEGAGSDPRRPSRRTPTVERLIHLRTQHLGPDELLIGAKVSFVDGLVGQRAGRRP